MEQVEQLHKIFKLCGSPPADYWKKSKLPHAMLFKPQQNYDSCLRETLKDLSEIEISLIETLLSIDPLKRGTASSALVSEVTLVSIESVNVSSLGTNHIATFCLSCTNEDIAFFSPPVFYYRAFCL